VDIVDSSYDGIPDVSPNKEPTDMSPRLEQMGENYLFLQANVRMFADGNDSKLGVFSSSFNCATGMIACLFIGIISLTK
jgi:hypothetical protein